MTLKLDLKKDRLARKIQSTLDDMQSLLSSDKTFVKFMDAWEKEVKEEWGFRE